MGVRRCSRVRPPLVLDTSAILSGRPLPLDGRLILAPGKLASEIQAGGPTGRALAYLEGRGLEYRDPSPAAVARVREAAGKSGDAARLSPTDVDVLALALDVAGEVLTDDYSIQNVAAILGVKATPILTRGITEVRTWAYRCRGCRREFDAPQKECPVCGSEVRTGRPVRS